MKQKQSKAHYNYKTFTMPAVPLGLFWKKLFNYMCWKKCLHLNYVCFL